MDQDENQQDPERILKQIQNEEKLRTRGTLKIFFGYAAGVGKTYTMLQAAHEAKEHGVDVVAGYIEPHARPDTVALLNGLEQLDRRIVRHGRICLREFDLDAALERKPSLILIDELAHTNAPGSRHHKRYQDVEEILNAGIDVFTTINVQHIESLNDTVEIITGINVRERIPDSVFDAADQVEIIDIEPQELLERLKSGRIYRHRQAQRAMSNFFTVENLAALREIALRRCADQLNTQSESSGMKRMEDYRTEEHILVCISTSTSNARCIRTAARMAQAFKGSFTALFVETPDFAAASDEIVQRLQANMRLAEQLGARLETVYGTDIPYQIAEFARVAGISKIVLGRRATRKWMFSRYSMTEKLISLAPQLDVYIIPDSAQHIRHARQFNNVRKTSVLDLIKSLAILACASLIGVGFDFLGFDAANIITVYVLGVLVTSVVIRNPLYGLASSLLSVLVFNFLFTEPRFSLHAYDTGYPVTFVIMLLASLMTSSLASRLKEHAQQSALTAFRTKLLFDVNQSLQHVQSRDSILRTTASHLIRLMQRDIIVYSAQGDSLNMPEIYYTTPRRSTGKAYITEMERAVALWVLKNNRPAGSTTQTLSNAICLYLPISLNGNVFGVIGIPTNEEEPSDISEKSIMLSIVGECALALENEKNAREKEEAAILAKQEQLRANLLRAISHDLRTPLTSISGNASNFLANGDKMDEETRKQLFTDIYDDSLWLINLVENLLSITRLKENHLNIQLCSELVSDVIDEALRHIDRRSKDYHITIKQEDDLLLARMDARLIVQVIINIVDNAIKYTPVGTSIEISTRKEDGMAVIAIADNGGRIPDEIKGRIFDMFFSAGASVSDSRRSLGLGLSLCRSIVLAHGGTITVSDNQPKGTIFTFTLPIEEINLNADA